MSDEKKVYVILISDLPLDQQELVLYDAPDDMFIACDESGNAMPVYTQKTYSIDEVNNDPSIEIVESDDW